jgi:GT2 family glycosyltransferase
VGGFDEKKFPVNFNDTDFCLRVRERGYKIVFTPYALLYHHEHATKGKDQKKEQIKRNEKEKKNFRKRWNKYISYDPFYNPNLSCFSNNFSLTLPKCRKF